MSYFTKNIRWLMPLLMAAAGLLTAGGLYAFSSLTTPQLFREGAVVWGTLGIIVTAAVWAVNAYPTKVGIFTYAVALGLLAGAFSGYADVAMLRLWAAPDRQHLFFIERTFFDRIVLFLAFVLSVTLIAAMNRKLMEMKARFIRHTDAEGLLREAELFKLRQQLQPHFLYNSLNAINSLVVLDPDKAQEMVGRLSDFLRSSVRKESNDLLPVSEELAYLEDYLAIEAVRFGDRLRIRYHKAYTDSAMLPPFLLQPLIENAIKFGLYGQTGEVQIIVDIALADGLLTVRITNPFDPQQQARAGTGFGLAGIRRRLFLLYGRDDLVQAAPEGDQFMTTLKIPQLHVQSPAH